MYIKQIKVRVWDKKTNIMLQGIELKQLLSYLVFQNCPNSDAYNLIKDHFKDLIWLEFTGFLTKDGKEIYDGDKLGEEKFVVKGRYWIVQWNNIIGLWEAVNSTSKTCQTLNGLLQLRDCNVIGHIYELTK